MEREHAIDLVRGLVEIPSLSRQESRSAEWLVSQMHGHGLERCCVDDVGNAVGELGAPDAPRTFVLLGHIDTVPGSIPVRVESLDGSPTLYGRGSVDAKGPLAAFTCAAARLGREWASEAGVRVVVVGAVEEESATSRGARFIRDRFDGNSEPLPEACIIGEPSGAERLTLGYKGRLLLDLEAVKDSAHTAGPDPGIATVATDLWNSLAEYASASNGDLQKPFEQLLPSLRSISSQSDGLRDSVTATYSLRLPLAFDVEAFARSLIGSAADLVGCASPEWQPSMLSSEQPIRLEGDRAQVQLRVRGYEAAWRSERSSPLTRAFLAGLRGLAPDLRLRFVLKTGTSDMNVVGPAWRCPVVAYGPGDSALDHTPNEHLDLDEFWRSVLVLEGTLRALV